jgi:hypothetical protein
MAVSNPRSRFGFELVEQPLFIPALLNILYPPILLSHQFLPVLQCTRASWFEQFERQKSVGDDTWQLMPDWTQGVPRPSLVCRPIRIRAVHWLAQYIALQR